MNQNRRYEEHEVHTIAAALYDGGWRAEDKDEMMEVHGFTEENMDLICDRLRDLAEWNEEEE